MGASKTARSVIALMTVSVTDKEMGTITELIDNRHKIMYVGEGIKRLSDRIAKPYRRTKEMFDPICIIVLVRLKR